MFRWIRVVSLSSLLVMACAHAKPDPSTAHHTENGFRNPQPDYVEKSFWDVLKWRWQQKEISGPETYQFELAKNDPQKLKANRTENTLTWIGHATALIQMQGTNILTDPHFSERASPVQWAGPRRVIPPGIAFEDLPEIHLIVISHDHYDSLDVDSVKRIHKAFPQALFLVPLGLKSWFGRLGIHQVKELDWWQDQEVSGLKVTCVPTRHWSKRSLFGRNTTLWAGWVFESPEKKVYFVGDSGMDDNIFKEIGHKWGAFDLSLIPIGAYEPRWFMSEHHMNPEEAVQIHKMVGSQKSVAIHWGTFVLSDERLTEPPKALAQALEQHQVPQDRFLVLKHGQTISW